MAEILIVEDNLFARKLSRTLLEREGNTVTEVESAEDAVTILETRSFNLIIMDHNLPGMTGLELMQIVRSKDNRTAILFITGAVIDSYDIVNQGATAVLKKPFGLFDLRSAVAHCLRSAGETDTPV